VRAASQPASNPMTTPMARPSSSEDGSMVSPGPEDGRQLRGMRIGERRGSRPPQAKRAHQSKQRFRYRA
jgi:hypothetical protein